MDYQPTSRRPIADGFRRTAHLATAACVRLNIHPDTISYLSMVAAALAAGCFWKSSAHPWLLIPAAAFCYLRLWFNMLDGMVALAAGKASWRGEILNDLPDRVSDILIFVGVAHSGLCAPLSAYWAALLAVLTAYVGMFGQAVGVQREFSGVTAVLDLTAEFDEATPFLKTNYLNVPILDLTAPTQEQLRNMAGFIANETSKGIVYVHCKIGYSRSAAAVGAWLLATHQAASVSDVVTKLRGARPSIIIRSEIVKALDRFAESGKTPTR